MALTATDYDNRGDDTVPFGFVYFSDFKRVAYAQGHGVIADATGGWGPVTAEHVALAENYLTRAGVNFR